MSKKYIELNSQYRNRTLYPNPADFRVNLSNSGMRMQYNAFDPVSKSYPINTFTGWTSVNCTYVTPSTGVVGLSAGSTFTVTGVLQTIDDYYVGCTISNGSTSQLRRIIGIKYLNTIGGNKYFQVTVDIPFDPFNANYTFTIYNASDFSGSDIFYIFIPDSVSLDNYYTGYSIYNRTLKKYAILTSFDKVTHLASFPYPGIGWNTTDIFYLARAPPSVYNVPPVIGAVKTLKRLSPGTGYFSQGDNISTFNTTSIGNTHILVGWETGVIDGGLPENIIITFGGYNDMVASNNVGDIIMITGAGNGDASYIIEKIYPTLGTLVVPFTIDQTYINSFVGIIYNNICQIYKIIGIDSGNVLILNDSNFIYPSNTLSSISLEFYPYTIDNVSPLVYTGSTISHTQSSCHNVTLTSLTLPNQILSPGTNAYVYPFVYVEFENICTSSVNAKNLIYSNNPNAYKAVFKVTIPELYNPHTLLFIRCTGMDMPQMIIFKQNTDLKMTIRLPGGDVFQTKTKDYLNGAFPNELLQISAIFSIEKI